MGCDIHWVVEKRFGDRWVGVYSTGNTPRFMTEQELAYRAHHKIPICEEVQIKHEGSEEERSTTPLHYTMTVPYYRYPAVHGRNYAFFAALAGVRGDGPEPKGVPDDASELALLEVEGWDAGGHSHSWDTLEQFLFRWVTVQRGDEEISSAFQALFVGDKTGGLLQKLAQYYTDQGEEYRVVYWFDN
jgi:hypothetical protein